MCVCVCVFYTAIRIEKFSWKICTTMETTSEDTRVLTKEKLQGLQKGVVACVVQGLERIERTTRERVLLEFLLHVCGGHRG